MVIILSGDEVGTSPSAQLWARVVVFGILKHCKALTAN